MAVRKPQKPEESAPRALYKDDIFETFVFWRSLPAQLRGESAEFYRSEGIEDPLVVELLAIKTQVAFAERFNVNAGTLSEWNHKIDDDNLLSPARTAWAKRLTSNVVSALYKAAMKEGDAPRVKLFMQLVEGWEEKSQQTVAGLEDLSRAIKALAERAALPVGVPTVVPLGPDRPSDQIHGEQRRVINEGYAADPEHSIGHGQGGWCCDKCICLNDERRTYWCRSNLVCYDCHRKGSQS